MESYDIRPWGRVRKYSNPEKTCRGRLDDTEETPPVGSHVVYWRCGDDRSESFAMPEVGGEVIIRHAREWGEAFTVNAACFERIALRGFIEQTAVGDTPDSWARFRRVA